MYVCDIHIIDHIIYIYIINIYIYWWWETTPTWANISWELPSIIFRDAWGQWGIPLYGSIPWLKMGETTTGKSSPQPRWNVLESTLTAKSPVAFMLACWTGIHSVSSRRNMMKLTSIGLNRLRIVADASSWSEECEQSNLQCELLLTLFHDSWCFRFTKNDLPMLLAHVLNDFSWSIPVMVFCTYEYTLVTSTIAIYKIL